MLKKGKYFLYKERGRVVVCVSLGIVYGNTDHTAVEVIVDTDSWQIKQGVPYISYANREENLKEITKDEARGFILMEGGK